MKILANNNWKEGFLDYYKSEEEYRIKVLGWKRLEELEDAYHIPSRTIRAIINYLPITGIKYLLRKAWSRLREDYRNEKYTSCGIGEIVEEAQDSKFNKGDTVYFVAPFHPSLVEKITLPKEFIFKAGKSTADQFPEDQILYESEDKKLLKNRWWKDIRGWSIYSGIEVTDEMENKMKDGVKETLSEVGWENAREFPIIDSTQISETRGEIPEMPDDEKTGVVFGYGHYAKTHIIPYSRPHVNIKAVHEIDPTQIYMEKRKIKRWDSAPVVRDDENYDVFFAASYNHTHVPLAIQALERDAYAVIEKPLVTTREQFSELKDAMKKSDKGVFIGFHKRYWTFNDYVYEDLNVELGDPISYNCIVYELIQPEFFWYNWPVSGTTFFSNGCHQIDHFLYLNDFSEPTNMKLDLLQDDSINVWIELENGATFTMVFTENGSPRVGPREHLELKANGRNVIMDDQIKYFSETPKKILRKEKQVKSDSYRNMYQEIGKKIANDESGDSMRSLRVSTETMLELEDMLKEEREKRNS